MSTNKEKIINDLILDVVGEEREVSKDELKETISNILREYNLSTDLSFIEKIATMKFNGNSSEDIDISQMPQELRDAAFLPVNTIADIALRQDIDLAISQIPEWFTALQVTRDAICESDVVTGKLARSIYFDKTKLDESETDNIMSKIEEIEDRLELHNIIKNHVVFNSLEYGESYIYAIPYSKVFEDLYKYRLNKSDSSQKNATGNMFETSSVLNGYGYHESAVEISLNDTIITDSASSDNKKSKNKTGIFTEAEIQEIVPMYHAKSMDEKQTVDTKIQKKKDAAFDNMITDIAKNIRYIGEDIALPVIEESAHDLRCVYETKYRAHNNYVQEVTTFFEHVMENSDTHMDPRFENIKGVYLRILPATKLIPVRIDRCVIGYYYISDLTRPEEAGERTVVCQGIL
jgi:hypothetical protein